VKQDFGEAARLYRNAADQGHARAQCNLGCAYEHGQGVKQDFGEAARLYRKAADQGDASAQCNLGAMYNSGQGVKQDFDEAARLFRKAADQGDADAQSNLGLMYAEGQGVKQDFGEALRWFRKAAAQGHEGAKKVVPRAEEELRKQRQAVAQASQPSSSNTCANCGVAEAAGGGALKPCSRCKAVVYCGRECQAQHWKAGGHKAVCKK
jgi:TPR repeat protein